ncbi:MAG: alpha/beta fold hydrolase [Gaiellaceae bacterium]
MSDLKMSRALVDTGLGQMHVRTVGEGDPLLLLHSQLVGGQWYDPVIPLLAPERKLIIPDRIGYGASDPAPRPLSFEEYASATVEVLDALGVESCDACGIHSGGSELIELATAHAARIRSAVMITVAVFTDEEATFFRENYSNPPPEPAEDGSHLKFYWDWWLGIKPETVDLNVAHRWMVDHLRASPNYYWTFNAAFDYPTADRLGSITQPLLVMGPHDDLWTQMERAIPMLPSQAKLVDMPHVTNAMAVFTEHTDETVQHIKAFLAA